MPTPDPSEALPSDLSKTMAETIRRFRREASPKGVPPRENNQDGPLKLPLPTDPGTIDPVTGSGCGPIL